MDAIITVDANQRIVLFNGAAAQVFGCTAAAVLGHPLDRFIPPAAWVASRAWCLADWSGAAARLLPVAEQLDQSGVPSGPAP